MTIKDKIQSWMDDRQAGMVQQYNALGFRASGQWEKELGNTLTESGGKYHGEITGANYTYWMENSRKAGKFPPIDAIRQWIKDKRIISDINEKSLAFLIARKIARKGTNHRPGLVSNVITDQSINDLFIDIGKIYVDQVKSDVIKAFK